MFYDGFLIVRSVNLISECVSVGIERTDFGKIFIAAVNKAVEHLNHDNRLKIEKTKNWEDLYVHCK